MPMYDFNILLLPQKAKELKNKSNTIWKKGIKYKLKILKETAGDLFPSISLQQLQSVAHFPVHTYHSCCLLHMNYILSVVASIFHMCCVPSVVAFL